MRSYSDPSVSAESSENLTSDDSNGSRSLNLNVEVDLDNEIDEESSVDEVLPIESDHEEPPPNVPVDLEDENLDIEDEHDKHVFNVEEILRKISGTRVFSIIIFYVISVAVYNNLEGWSILDAFYFITTTVTTVGYGDFYPTSNLSRLYTILVILVGFTLVYPELYWVGCTILEYMDRKVSIMGSLKEGIHKLKWLNGCIFLMDKYLMSETRALCRQAKISRNDHDAWNNPDYLKESDKYVKDLFYEKLQLYYTVLLCIVSMFMIMLLGALFIWTFNIYSFNESFYLAIVTTTSVGYGELVSDMRGMKIFLIFYIPNSVIACGICVGQIVRSLRSVSALNKRLEHKTVVNPGYSRMIKKLCRRERRLSIARSMVSVTNTAQPSSPSRNNSNSSMYSDAIMLNISGNAQRDINDPRIAYLSKAQYIIEMLLASDNAGCDINEEIVQWGHHFDTIDVDKSGTLDQHELESFDRMNYKHTRKCQLSVVKWYERNWIQFVRGKMSRTFVNKSNKSSKRGLECPTSPGEMSPGNEYGVAQMNKSFSNPTNTHNIAMNELEVELNVL